MTPDDPDTLVDSTLPEGVLTVRLGPGANCSSIGSVVDILFVSATVGGALLAALSAAVGPSREAKPSTEAASAEPIDPPLASRTDDHDR